MATREGLLEHGLDLEVVRLDNVLRVLHVLQYVGPGQVGLGPGLGVLHLQNLIVQILQRIFLVTSLPLRLRLGVTSLSGEFLMFFFITNIVTGACLHGS